jgi:hypothetical protein
MGSVIRVKKPQPTARHSAHDACRFPRLCPLALLAGSLVFGADGAFAARPLSEVLQACLRKAERHVKHGWTYLHLEGAPGDRGFQHGYLLASEIAESLRVTRALWEHDSAMEWPWLLEKTMVFLEPKVDTENLAEIDGMVDGLRAAGVSSSRAELIVYNAWFELDWYWWPKEKKKLGSDSSSPPKQSCSSFIATGSMTADGGIVLGHNSMVDYPEATANVILDVLPEKGHRILMQTWPGWIHSGTDFFVTDAGLVGSETTIGGFDGYEEKGIPEFVRMRRATQDATSIDEWCDVMKRGNNGGYANAWLLGDVRSGEIARLELGLKHIGLERKRDGFFVGSNIAEDLKVLRLETEANESDVRLSSVARRVRWKKLMAQYAGKIDLKLAKRFEADHYDPYFEKVHPGGRCLCAHYELDRQFWGTWPGGPLFPAGTFDGKVVDSRMAKEMSFAARWGAACGRAFDAERFLAAHPQFDWMKGILKSRPSQPWTVFRAGEKN